MVEVSIRDNGEGMPREHRPRMTERFYRVDAARSRALGGTGLGLAIVKHILNRHRGRLAIESTPGEGSVFTVTLPAAQGSAPDTRSTEPRPSAKRNPSVVNRSPEPTRLQRAGHRRRSDARRHGKGCVGTCGYRGWTMH